MLLLFRRIANSGANKYFKLNKHSNRFIGNIVYKQLSLKGLICSQFPFNVDLNEILSKKQTIYAGFDATNKSLHVGNLLVLISLLHLLHYGHRIILLIGDATARIGDPSGKIKERPILTEQFVESNANGIESDIKQVLKNYKKYFTDYNFNEKNLIILRNSSWYNNLNVIDFVDKYARQLRMADMLSKNSIKERLNSSSGLSFAEFSYQTFQAYDWYYLFKKYQCRFQIGGIDQMVNIHNGYDLVKKIEQQPVYGLFVPLITDDKGNKLGKTEGKTIFLNANSTTPFGFYQYFMRLPDSKMNNYLKLFSFRSDIENIIQNHLRNPKPWFLQKLLAQEMTKLVHGQCGLLKAEHISKSLFEKDLNKIGLLNETEIIDAFEGMPFVHLEFTPDQMTVLNLANKTGFFSSELAAIKAIEEGGFYVNYKRVLDPGKLLEEKESILQNGLTIVSLGKRNYRIIKWL